MLLVAGCFEACLHLCLRPLCDLEIVERDNFLDVDLIVVVALGRQERADRCGCDAVGVVLLLTVRMQLGGDIVLS